MKWILFILLGVVCGGGGTALAERTATPHQAQEAAQTESARETSALVIGELMASFFNSPGIKKNSTYAILPVASSSPDSPYHDQFRNAFTYNAVGSTPKLYSGSGEQFQQLVETFANSQDIRDVLDPATIQKLGKMIDFEALIVPRIHVESLPDGVRIFHASMGVYSRETGEITWGGETRRRIPGTISNGEVMRYAKWGLLGLSGLFIAIFVIRRILIAARPT